jgi:GAF domain-containing protein
MDTSYLDDPARLDALCSLGVLDTPPEQRFDRFTRIAAAALHVPIALVSLVDRDRQWFKSRVGLAALQTSRSVAFCGHTVAQRALLEVQDALADVRFRDNPLVTGAPHIRFYAGVPLFSRDGHALGSLCVVDTQPRSLSDADRELLRDLASLVEDELCKANDRT